jgi:hypothetical protein
LDRFSEGAEVIIVSDAGPVAILRAPEVQHGPGRLLSESITILKTRGSTVTLDGDFERVLNKIFVLSF